jgi:predicted flap endonuclease-1-like 5' DNA nuclease
VNRNVRYGAIAAAAFGAVVAAAWLLKDRLAGPAPAAAPTPPVAPVAPTPPPTPPGEPDDLSTIKGIGPVYRTRLEEAGIVSFAALATADAVTLAEQVEAPASRVQAWIDAARRLRS